MFYRELQKATRAFTTNIGEGEFGPVYKAQMATGQTVAIKVLATDSRQGAMEFLTEVTIDYRLQLFCLLSTYIEFLVSSPMGQWVDQLMINT